MDLDNLSYVNVKRRSLCNFRCTKKNNHKGSLTNRVSVTKTTITLTKYGYDTRTTIIMLTRHCKLFVIILYLLVNEL